MSWITGYKAPTKKSSEDLREEKRKKLEAERELRSKQRAQRQQELEDIAQAKIEADKAYQELLDIEPEILVSDNLSIAASEADRLLSEELEEAEMVDFQDENGTDADKAVEKLGGLQCPFDKNDLEFWFSGLESQLEILGVKSQWVKRLALQRVLPIEIQQDVKSLLRLPKSGAGDDIYKRVKTKLLQLYGQKPEADYIRAKNRVMSGKPSQLGEALVDDLCKLCDEKLSGCCANIVWAMFREALPVVIRNHIARMKFDKDTYLSVFEAADLVYSSNQGAEPAVAAVASSPEVAAVSVKNKYQGQRQSGQNKGQTNRNQSQNRGQNGQNKNQGQNGKNKGQAQTENKGQKHATATGETLCKIHYKFGVNANFCVSPWKCQMKDVLATPH